ncbi:heavy-metal-associated domain-containing protein [Ruania sp. N2-46]|uniref:Heavy-metal-associated domain-containing protein n=2 Tax=Occultella gossypii TaxID=2800820 RepID=A0ABS7SCA8_9MICO|nr:heavy-metal-associated domain-containing protein [Occultella gossypii]
MQAPVKLTIFAAGLAVLFGGAFAVGSASGVQVETQPPAHPEEEASGEGDSGHAGTDESAGDDGADESAGHDGAEGSGHDSGPDAAAAAEELPVGVLSAAGGYRLDSLTVPGAVGVAGTLSFRVLDAHGDPVTEYTTQHERDLHLIVASQDTSQFRHVHPTLGADGTWSIDWTWPTAGSHRVYADFLPAAAEDGLTLAQDVTVPGIVTTVPLPAAGSTAVVDEYTVTLSGDLTTEGGPLAFEISRDGDPVTDLDPYLGAYGHLVALRVGDLAYLHTHPEGEAGVSEPGPLVEFMSTAPSPGTYRLFLDFSHQGVVHTADFTVEVTR